MGLPDIDTSVLMDFSVGVLPRLTGQVNCRQPDKIIVTQYRKQFYMERRVFRRNETCWQWRTL